MHARIFVPNSLALLSDNNGVKFLQDLYAYSSGNKNINLVSTFENLIKNAGVEGLSSKINMIDEIFNKLLMALGATSECFDTITKTELACKKCNLSTVKYSTENIIKVPVSQFRATGKCITEIHSQVAKNNCELCGGQMNITTSRDSQSIAKLILIEQSLRVT